MIEQKYVIAEMILNKTGLSLIRIFLNPFISSKKRNNLKTFLADDILYFRL